MALGLVESEEDEERGREAAEEAALVMGLRLRRAPVVCEPLYLWPDNVRSWNLFQADFLTATRVRDAINARWPGTATVIDGTTVSLRLPAEADARASRMAAIEMIDVKKPLMPPAVPPVMVKLARARASTNSLWRVPS